MKRIIAQILCTVFLFSAAGGTVWGAKIELDPAQIQLVTDFNGSMYQRDFGKSMSMPMPNPNVQGPYRINLKGIGEKKELEINFQALNPEVYALMANQLAFRYCIQSEGNEGQWSEWKNLSQLPLKIKLRDQKPNSPATPQVSNHSPKEVVVFIQIRVPQTLELRQGVYVGEFLLQVT